MKKWNLWFKGSYPYLVWFHFEDNSNQHVNLETRVKILNWPTMFNEEVHQLYFRGKVKRYAQMLSLKAYIHTVNREPTITTLNDCLENLERNNPSFATSHIDNNIKSNITKNYFNATNNTIDDINTNATNNTIHHSNTNMSPLLIFL